ncbi:SHOCT domain-containing protein [Fonticella tunisiensis]|uniref:Putative membrane protein n=1 Tax=Fonticella tunisiensis TaxID=1096341 RepID=A0A4V3ET11_9CLOT|nr:SHOCT domain-containing protein [Fonticella tunisiensis]TDT57298.1 putative membrane protein [Fonticella tunisiensis]
MFYGCGGFGYGWGPFGMIIPIILFGVIIYAVFKLFERDKMGYRYRGTEEALEILNMRYARGEITEEEYLSRKKALRNNRF